MWTALSDVEFCGQQGQYSLVETDLSFELNDNSKELIIEIFHFYILI